MNITEPKLVKYPCEKSAIRFFDTKDLDDMWRLRKIVENGDVQDMMDSVVGMSKQDRIDWAEEKGKYGRYFMFAIEGTEAIFGTEKLEEIGKVQGFVYLYAGSDEKRIINRMIGAGFVSKDEVGEKKIFEISFAKLPESPGGQISSATRQACLELKRVNEQSNGTGVFVFCFIDEDNVASMRVVEACGFVRRGRHFYELDSEEKSALYILDFERLKAIMKEKQKNC